MAKIDVEVIISAVDRASGVLRDVGHNIEGVGNRFGDLVKQSTAASFAFAGAITLAGKSIIDVASDIEQAKVSFTVMTGSAEVATKTLSDLSNFAKKTPFTFPSIVEASKRLLAYNIEAKDLIPTLTTLGNIASGVGMEKMPQLILAFGQVKAATRLTGMELRQFSEAGVPLLQALVDQANKAGGVLTTVGGTSAKTREKMDDLNATLQKQTNRFTEMTASGKTSSASYKNLEITIGETKEKLASLGPVSEGVTKRVKVTAEQMKEMISDGTVSFAQVQAALESIGGAQGKWGDLMDKQSRTFAGRMSNISDQLVRVALNLAGISTEAKTFGNIIQGGAFDLLSQGVQKVLDALNALEPRIKGFIDTFLSNQQMMAVAIGALTAGLLGAAAATIAFLAPWLTLVAIGAAVGLVLSQLIEWMGGLDNVVKIATTAFAFMAMAWNDLVKPGLDSIIQLVRAELIPELQKLWQVVGPILIPILQFLAAVLGVTLLLAIRVIIEVLKVIIQTFIDFSEKVRGAIGLVQAVIEALKKNVKLDFDSILGFIDVLTGGWISKFNLIKGAVEGVIGAIGSLISKAVELGNKVKGGLKIPGFQAGGIVPGAIGEPRMIMAHGGEEVVPVGKSSSGGAGSGALVFNVNIGMYTGSEIEKRNVAGELYRSLVKIARAQNKSVSEMMGG